MRSCPRAATAIALLLLAACERQPATTNDGLENASAGNTAAASPILPVARKMDREGLLLAVNRAASAAGAGADDRTAQDELGGTEFSFRFRAGCDFVLTAADEPDDKTISPRSPSRQKKAVDAAASPARAASAADPAPALTVEYDAEAERLRFRATPDFSLDAAPPALAGGTAYEAVEGFWVPQPWLLTPACPASAPAPDSAPAPAPAADSAPASAKTGGRQAPATTERVVAIAQFFTAGDSRSHRRADRAYEWVSRIPPEALPSPNLFDFVITGRLQALPDRKIISCAAQGGARPVCIVSARITEVRLERPDGEVLARWASG